MVTGVGGCPGRRLLPPCGVQKPMQTSLVGQKTSLFLWKNDVPASDGNSEAELTQVAAAEHRSFHFRFLIEIWNGPILNIFKLIVMWPFPLF